jgi:hypothetical protein
MGRDEEVAALHREQSRLTTDELLAHIRTVFEEGVTLLERRMTTLEQKLAEAQACHRHRRQ